MKNYHAWILYTLLGTVGVGAAEQRAAPPTSPRAMEGATTEVGKPRIVQRWTDGRIWERVTTYALTNDTTVFRTNRWTDLASGMHYWDVNHWKESRAEILVTQEGAEARQGPHKVQFSGNINTAGAITITSAEGQTLRAQVVGLAYTDLSTGESVLIASVRDSVGLLLPPNQVLYPAAFDGLLADLRYTYTRQGFEQDVILRESPSPPSDYGLKGDAVALEVWTEFDAPVPESIPASLEGISDETLKFGKLRIARGRAFALDAEDPRMGAAPVGKTWLQANGRQYLIESVPHRALEKELKKLPDLRAGVRGVPAGFPALKAQASVRPRLGWLNGLEKRRAAAPTPVRLGMDKSVLKDQPGLVLDYIIEGGDLDDFTFQTDTTYLISGGLNIWGTTTFEGGTVLKYATTNDVVMQLWGATVWKTDPYRPAIFTSQNDQTVGLDFTAADSPMKYFGALACTAIYHEFQHLRISHAKYGLHTSTRMKLRDAQFTECDKALYTEFGAADIDNVLFYNSGRVFAGSKYTNSVRHVTINQCAQLSEDWANTNYSRVWLTNSLLVNVTNLGSVSLTTNFTVTTTSNIFQTVGAGAHYLADPSPYRDAGTTNLPATLAARLRKTTTYPPLIIAPVGGYYGVSQTLTPRSGLDTDTPDLGYHYNPIDYAFSFIYLTNATITVEPGTAIAVFNTTNSSTYGLAMGQGGRFLAAGRADNKINVTHYATVQEMVNTNWNGPIYSLLMSFSSAAGNEELRCRFTDFSVLADSAPPSATHPAIPHLYASDNSSKWSFTDCQFYGGSIWNGNIPMTTTNSLFHRTYQELILGSGVTSYWYNCTFNGGSLFWYSYSGSNYLRVHDSLFLGTTLDSEVVSSHIGYSGTGRLTPTNASDRVLTGLVFQAGSLGYFYVPTNTALFNNGSRNATNAGLYHYTTLTNNVKETNTVVDIGFHYVATGTKGLPFDSDGDGVPDYWEDLNGNGTWEGTEINWQNADTDGDGVSDGLELLQGRNPRGNVTTDTLNLINLRVFTPLK